MRRGTSRKLRRNVALAALARRECFVRQDLPGCLAAVAATAVEALGVERASIWLLDQPGSVLECTHTHPADALGPACRRIRVEDHQTYFDALRNARVLSVADGAADPRTASLARMSSITEGTTALLDAPVLLRGRVVGVVRCEQAGRARRWLRADQDFAGSLADLVALALAGEERSRLEQRLRLTASATRSAVWDHDAVNDRTWWSPEYYQLLDLDPETVRPSIDAWQRLIHPEDRDALFTLIDACRMGLESGYRLAYRMRRGDGSWFWVEDACHLIRDEDGKPLRWVGIKSDATQRKEDERARQAAEERFRTLFENAVEGLWLISSDGRLIEANPALASMLGYGSAEALLRVPHARALFADAERWDKLIGLLDDRGRVRGFEAELLGSDGRRIWATLNFRAVTGDDGRIRLEGSVADITHLKRAQAQLAHAVLHDGLTGLPNRHLLVDRLDQAMARRKLAGSGWTSVILVDYDDLRLINDSLGHGVGDAMLVELARRLRNALRPGDTLSRLGSDEFAIVTESLPDAAMAEDMVDAIRGAVSAPVTLHGHDIFPSVSVGVALDAGERETAEDFLRDAGVALHEAKGQGRARTQFFAPMMRPQPLLQLQLQSDLRRALKRNEFALYYQPVLDLATRTLVGFEALLRWKHPQRGLVPPNLFVPVAEERGMLPELGNWVLSRACRQIALWQQRIPADRPFSVSINIAPSQLTAPELFATLDEVLADTGVDVHRIKFEITEAALSGDADLIAGKLHRMRERGIAVLVDDFGTGYSSLGRLHRFSMDGLKIDQSFVRPLLVDRDSAAIVRSIVALGKALGLAVIAEGVECEATALELSRLNCDFAQGYHFSQPLPSSAADILVQEISAGKRAEAVVA